MSSPSVTLLGPQRARPTIGEVIERQRLAGPFALITAGWQEREAEDDELREAVGHKADNLHLYQRFEQVLAASPHLAAAIGARQEALRELQELYRLRLKSAMQAARQLWERPGRDELLEPERESAIEAVRQLDRHHLSRVADVRRDFETALRRSVPRELLRHQSELSQRIHDAAAVLIAGGHVAVLFNRLDLFSLGAELRHRPVIAWSAGAMVVSERIALFHDSPPQGPGHAELLDRGLGLCRGLLPLPHGSARLRLDDSERVALFARRFADLRPVVLDPGAELRWEPPRWHAVPPALELRADGSVTPWQERSP